MKVSDVVGSIVLLIFSTAAYYEAGKFTLGTDAFPKAILIVIIILAAIQLALALKSRSAIAFTAATEPIHVPRMVAMGVLFFAYIIAIQVIGYFIATPLFLMGSMHMLGRRDMKTILMVTAIVTFLIYLVFRTFLYVPVPMGPLFRQ